MSPLIIGLTLECHSSYFRLPHSCCDTVLLVLGYYSSVSSPFSLYVPIWSFRSRFVISLFVCFFFSTTLLNSFCGLPVLKFELFWLSFEALKLLVFSFFPVCLCICAFEVYEGLCTLSSAFCLTRKQGRCLLELKSFVLYVLFSSQMTKIMHNVSKEKGKRRVL